MTSYFESGFRGMFKLLLPSLKKITQSLKIHKSIYNGHPVIGI